MTGSKRGQSTHGGRTSAPRGSGCSTTDAKIAFDRFHIMRQLTAAVESAWRQERRDYLGQRDGSPVTGTTYLWTFSDEGRPDGRAMSLATLRALDLEVGRGRAIRKRC